MPASSIRSRTGDYWQRHDPWKSVCGSGTGKNIPYMSGPQWLHDFVLRDRGCWPLQVHTAKPPPREWRPDSGTVWLQTGLCNRRCAGELEVSARLGESDFFVIEADEYDAPSSTNALNLSITARVR